MPTLRSLRTPSRLLALLVLASPIGCGSSEQPSPEGTGPIEDVELLVDDLGITHVYARSDGDAFFGAGYAMARDRLFQMEVSRRRALGRNAELFGEPLRKSDIQARVMNFARLGEADWRRTVEARPEDAELVRAWVRGVNQRIAEVARGDAPRPYGLGPAELDFVPEPWTEAHPFAIGKTLAFGLSNTLDFDVLASVIRRVAPGFVEQMPVVLPAYDTFAAVEAPAAKPPAPKPPKPAGSKAPGGLPPLPDQVEPFMSPFASNNWAVGGAHTTSGKPLLAGDPHQGLTSPIRFWPFHMSSVEHGGTLDVIGFSFVGTPTVELGHNAHVGWTATTNYADVMDLLEVTVASGTVNVGGASHAVETRKEIIKVRSDGGGPPADTAVVVRDVPGQGVLLPDEALPVPSALVADRSLLFKWTGFEPTLELSAYLALDRAVDLDAFEAAVDRIEVGAQNFIAADAAGIAYRVHANVPDRGDPSSRPMPWHAVDGSDPQNGWSRGFLPPSKLPHLRNPERGFLSSANNDPFGFTADGDVENDPYYYGAFFSPGQRAHSIDAALRALLEQKKVDRADMEALQRDVRSPTAETLVPHLLEAVAAVPTDPALAAYQGRDDLVALAGRLGSWDRRFDRAAAAPVIFLAFEWFAAQRAFSDALTPALFNALSEVDAPQTLLGWLRNVVEQRFEGASAFMPEGRRAFLLASLDAAAAWLVKRFGSIDAPFTLGDVHAAEFKSELGGKLAVPRVTVDGSTDTINVSPAPFFKGGAALDQFTSRQGSLYRMVVGFDAGGAPEATIDFPRGTREDPADPHFADQESRWAAAQHTALPFRRADVDARASERSTLRGRR